MINSFYSNILIVACFAWSSLLSGQSVNWLSWEEAMDKTEQEPKKILVDIYTEWCGWCKKMDQTTFQNPELVEYLNENYYTIKFDAQYKNPITYKGKTYKLENSIWKGGYHQLTAVITEGQSRKLPTIVFLDEKVEILQAIPGFRTAKELEIMAAYFEGNFHRTTPWKTFVSIYKSKKKDQRIDHDSSKQVLTRLASQKKN